MNGPAMSRRHCVIAACLPPVLLLLSCATPGAAANEPPPNVVIIFTDDQGYGDLGCFGSETLQTPRIDALAEEGLRLTSFYVSAAVCSPSRAALLTGCYHKRISVNKVLFPGELIGLNPNETTIAEMLKPRGYATACIGKWHLGDQPEFLPTRQGFDEFFGIPYSNDMYPQNNLRHKFPPLPLMQDEEVIETNPDQDELTQRLTDRAVEFIERSREKPFFLYFAHPMPHRPCHASAEARRAVGLADREIPSYPQKTPDNDFVYPATMYDIDLSTGRIIDKLRELKLDRRTLVIFTSDNGPAVGSAGPLRGRKGAPQEGGMRVPFVAWWPGEIAGGGESEAIAATIDLLPTIAAISGADLPEKPIDGVNLWPLLAGRPDIAPPRETFLYYRGASLA
ncbi:MAG: sulfatase, partial [Pirellulales bacterium]